LNLVEKSISSINESILDKSMKGSEKERNMTKMKKMVFGFHIVKQKSVYRVYKDFM